MYGDGENLVTIQQCFSFILLIKFSVNFVPALSKTKHLNSVSDEELMKISQILFDEDENDLLPLVKINFQGYLNSSKISEDRAPEKWDEVFWTAPSWIQEISRWFRDNYNWIMVSLSLEDSLSLMMTSITQKSSAKWKRFTIILKQTHQSTKILRRRKKMSKEISSLSSWKHL